MEVARGMNDRQADTALVYEVSALRPPELRTKSTSKPHYGGHAKQPSGAVVEWTDRRSHGDMMELQSRLLQLLGEDEVLVDLIPADDGTVADLLQLVEEAQPYEEAIKVLQKPGHGMPVIAMVSKVWSHDMMSSEASEALQQVCVGDVIKSIDGKDMIGKGVDTVRNALKGRGHLQNEHGLWSSARNGPAASIPSPLHPGKKAKQPTVTVCFKRTSLTNTKLVSELKAISLSTNETGLLTRDLLNGNNNQTQQAHQRARFMLGQVTNLLDKITQAPQLTNSDVAKEFFSDDWRTIEPGVRERVRSASKLKQSPLQSRYRVRQEANPTGVGQAIRTSVMSAGSAVKSRVSRVSFALSSSPKLSRPNSASALGVSLGRKTALGTRTSDPEAPQSPSMKRAVTVAPGNSMWGWSKKDRQLPTINALGESGAGGRASLDLANPMHIASDEAQESMESNSAALAMMSSSDDSADGGGSGTRDSIDVITSAKFSM